MNNIPEVKLGILAVSRDCFPVSLSEKRRSAVVRAYNDIGGSVYECPIIVENEEDALNAISDINQAGCNALCVFLGNFGPETPETLLAKYFDGPVMYAAAAEESGKDLIGGRGDAYCGLLNCSYNLGLRKLRAVIPSDPVGDAGAVAAMMADFVPVARALTGLRKLKIITFGPRPQDFMACNAPIQALYDLGVEIEENSELDLLVAYHAHAGDPRIKQVAAEMAGEVGEGGELLAKLAQYELTLLDWAEGHKGARSYVAFANKCWPAFQTEFGFVPCYVNARLTASGIPVACETDVYGALSEYVGVCVTGESVTLLDINNTVPKDLFEEEIRGKFGYELSDTFMGFHCGNTPACRLKNPALKHQLIMKRLLEPDREPNITRGTLEGDIKAGDVTLYRLQSGADTRLKAYIAQGEVLPVASRSFGGIGIFAIPEMARFYRNVLIHGRYPHHGAVAFGHVGSALFTVFAYLGVDDIGFNRPKGYLYEGEDPFAGKNRRG